MQSDALQHIDQAGVRVDALQAAGHHEALQESRLLSTQFGPTNKPFFRPMGITRKARSKQAAYRHRLESTLRHL